MLGLDHLIWNGEALIDFLNVWFGRGGFADAQAWSGVGGQDDGANLMGFECVSHGRPGGVDALLEEGFFDRDEKVVSQHAKEEVSLDAMLELMEDRSFGERRLHVAEGILGAGEQAVDAPEFVA